ncbi:methyltransferase, FxLD system [Actinosynnema sp. NPDC050436]|uniref:methyltransferase, FxLD system n=1 Tax=Actinosynnema sp. NPDC050436 TaxID=3155659 RepID=UPI0033FF2D53
MIDDTEPDELRVSMVDAVLAAGHRLPPAVERALRAVPRHLFVPDAPLADAYANRSITIKPGPPGGRPASCISVPTVVAMMLAQLDPRPGERGLEIGAGTGYNAALLDHCVGTTGQVTTVDIHPDVTDHACRALAATGHDRVRVVTGDGAHGHPDNAPYDWIIVTVGPWDLPPAWSDQLAPGGRLVVPLTWRGQTRSVAFVKQDNSVLRAQDSRLCGFIPMIGDDQHGERVIALADDVALHHDPDQPFDPDRLRGVLDRPSTTVWSGASIVPMESTDLIWPLLTGLGPGTCRFAAAQAAVDAGLADPAFAYSSPALAEGDSLAYLTLRRPAPDTAERRFELGAIGHGPAGAHLAERLCAGIRAWDHDRTAQPVITAYPAGTPDDDLADGQIVDKQHTRLVITA